MGLNEWTISRNSDHMNVAFSVYCGGNVSYSDGYIFDGVRRKKKLGRLAASPAPPSEAAPAAPSERDAALSSPPSSEAAPAPENSKK